MLVPLSSHEFAHSTVVQALMDYKRPILERCHFISSQVELACIPRPPKLKCAEVTAQSLVKVGVQRDGKRFRFGTTATIRSEVEDGRYSYLRQSQV